MIYNYIDPVAFYLFSRPVYWYGVIISLTIFICYYIAEIEARKLNIPKDTMLDLLLISIPVAIISARIYYVIFRWDYYSKNKNEIIAIWDGGIAIYGGLIGALIVTIIFSKKRNISFIKLLDIIAPSLLLGQTLGRWGNFFNKEAYGEIISREVLEKFYIPEFIIKNMYIAGEYRHPTFLYESIWCLIAFIILILIRKYLYIGEIVSSYFILYGLERFIIEGMRTDSLYIGAFRVSQLLSIIIAIIGIIYIIYNRFINKNNKIYYINS